MRHLVMFSGGAGSYAAAKRVVAEHGPANTLLIFADTKMEDEDLYRFVGEAVAKLYIDALLYDLKEGHMKL